MRILQVNTIVGQGSTGRIAENIGRRLIEAGHQSYIAFGRGHGASQSTTLRIGSRLDQAWHGLMTRLLDRHGLHSGSATRVLVREIEKIRPDAVLLHNLHGYYLNFPVLMEHLKQRAMPVFWTLHDCWPFTGHCAHFIGVACDKWQSGCGQCPALRAYPASWHDGSRRNFRIKKAAFSGFPDLTLIAPSQWLADALTRSSLGEYPVRVIPNGVDLKSFRPGARSQGQAIVLGVANVWSRTKGLDDFCRLRSRLPAAVRIVLIGLSSQQIARLPIGVEGRQRTASPAELAEWYQQASVFVNPTYSDTFPTTNIEALACGTPVVSYGIGGSAEAFDEHTGRVAGPGDIDGLANAIMELIDSDAKVLSERCRARAEAFFNEQDRTAEYVDLLTSH